ncbi:MAG: hypothetical protein ACYSWU_05700, partial [Planctomycetota bacterium]
AAAERAEMGMVTDVFPLILKLPNTLPGGVADENWRESNYNLMNLDNFVMHLGDVAIDAAVYRCDRDYYTAADLADIKYVMQHVVTKHRLSISQLRFQMFRRASTVVRGNTRSADEITAEQWFAFLRELRDSSYATAKVHGFHGLIAALDRRTAAGQAAREAVAREALAWLDKFESGRLPGPQPKHLGYGTERFLRRICENCLPAEAGVVKKIPAQIKAEMARRRAEHEAKYPRPPEASAKTVSPGSPHSAVVIGRLRFEPIDLKVRNLDGSAGSSRKGLLGLTPCGDALDVAWSEHAVLLMHTPGLLTEVLADPDEQFVGAKWDGRSIWVAGLCGGIVVLDRAGDVIGRVGRQQGLPPHDKKLLLHPIEPDRCVAAGQFGPQGRAWCAMIERAEPESEFRVRVLHEAAKVSLKDRHNTPDDPQLAFEPAGLHVCDAPLEGRPVLYVHRQAPSHAAHGNPLVVDLSTLEVRIAQKQIFHAGHAITIRRHPTVSGGPTRRMWEFHIPHWEVMERDWPDGKPPLCRGEIRVPRLLYHDGCFYETQGGWLRMNARTWDYEYLVDGLLPWKFRHLKYAVSAHYGLVGWNPIYSYRIIVEEGTQNENQSGRQGQPAGAEKTR